MALALRDVKKTKEVGTDTYNDPPGPSSTWQARR